MDKIAIVIPCIRKESIDKFMIEWEVANWNDNIKLFVIEDHIKKEFKLLDSVNHYCHEDIEKEFPYPQIIPRATSAIRLFGFWKAKQQGYDYILTLDDDCYPNDKFTNIMQIIDECISRIKYPDKNNKWFNTIETTPSRGMPSNIQNDDTPIKVCVGAWTKVPDLDGKWQVMFEESKTDFPIANFIPTTIPYGQMYTLCGMAVFFPIDVAKYMFWFPTLNKYFRYDDIWMGFTIKRLFDDLGWGIHNATFSIKHSRASNAKRNLELESTNNGYEVNDKFAKYILDSYKRKEQINTVEKVCNLISELNDDYFKTTADYYLKWYKSMEN